MADKIILPELLRVLMPEGPVAEVKLETYLASVVGTEMSPSAPIEALKVQAVASRTYVASAHRHPEANADVCTTAHCQRWRRIDPIVAPEVFRAVSETWGIIAAHDGKLIDAYYFEHCDGKTRNAEDVLTTSLPYLRSVECPCGFVGMRGHGLGLCQRGVIVMARRGATFEQILRHYYRGVVIQRATHSEPPQSAPKPTEMPAKISPRKKTAPVEKKPTAPKIETPAPRAETPTPLPDFLVPPPALDDSTRALMKELERLKQLTQDSLREATADSTIAPTPREEPVQPAPKISPPIILPVEPTPAPADAAPVLPRVEHVEAARTETPSQVARRVVIDHLPGARLIAGSLPRADIAIVIEDVDGDKQVVFSGSAPAYGTGGFEIPVQADGRYFVSMGSHSFEVHVSGDTVFIHAQNLEIQNS